MASRPTLAQLAAGTAGADGWACPRCGCEDWRVEDSYWVTGAQERRRRRFCRNCKQVLHTREVPIEPADAERKKSSSIIPANSTSAQDELTQLGIVCSFDEHDDADDGTGSDRTKRARA